MPWTQLIIHLKEMYGIRNKKNVKNHLKALKDDHCIEIVSKRGKRF